MLSAALKEHMDLKEKSIQLINYIEERFKHKVKGYLEFLDGRYMVTFNTKEVMFLSYDLETQEVIIEDYKHKGVLKLKYNYKERMIANGK